MKYSTAVMSATTFHAKPPDGYGSVSYISRKDKFTPCKLQKELAKIQLTFTLLPF